MLVIDPIFAVISLMSTIFCIGLGGYVLYLNKKSELNQIFFLVTLTGFIYTFTTVLMWLSPDPEIAFLWHKAGTMWPIFVASVLHFALIFTNNRFFKLKLNYLILYVPAIAFWITDLTTDLINTPPILKPWGYNDQASGTILYGVSTVWSALLPLLAFGLCLRYYFKAKETSLRQRAKLVSIGFIIPIISFIGTNMISRTMGIDVPNLGPFSAFFLSLFVGYAITNYDLFTIDSALAAENIAATLPGSLVLTDIKGRILKVNDNLINTSGFSREELVGQPISKFSGENAQNLLLKEISQSNQLRDREFVMQAKDGTNKYMVFSASVILNRSNRPIGFTFILTDITQRKLAEIELANTKNYLETLLNSMLTGVLVIDAKSHRVMDVNATALSMLGLRREEVVGRGCHKFICPSEEGKCPITDLGFNVNNDEKILLTANGEQKQILKSVIKLQLQDKLFLIENFVDISARKAMEAQLVKSQRLASIGELAGQLGHDLRNPLAGIKNGVYLIEKKNSKMTDEQRQEILQVIKQAVEDSNRIVSSLIDYSTELVIIPSLCTPKALVASTLAKIKFPSEIKVENLVVDETKMLLDTEHIERMFAAILQNAIQAIPKEGIISIQTIASESDVSFSISDTGVGIPEGLLPNIFGPLVTTKAKGMGMGLAICKRIVEAHGGSIVIESRVGVGTTIKVTLPIKQSKSAFAVFARA
jgi:PAS domain S-box-containing protein